MEKVTHELQRELRTEALRLIKALAVHGCDLPKLKDDAMAFQDKLYTIESDKRPTDLTDALTIIVNKLTQKEQSRARWTSKRDTQ